MNSRGGIKEKARSAASMLCPCCGDRILLDEIECGCGARFVGAPLDEAPIKVLRLGPAITSVAMLALVVVAGIVVTKWFGFAGVIVAWFAWRALKLGKRNPDWYGGRKTAAATFAVSIAGVAILGSYGVIRILEVLDNYQTQENAITQAAMYHYCGAIEEYRRGLGGDSYPRDAQDLKRHTGESLPVDYWERSIRYQSSNPLLADRSVQRTRIPITSFELRSAGPDGLIGTDDDIVMLDGIFITSAELKKQSATQQLR
ncbi:MAG TPA: hypothetical protein VLM38_20165 [Blastocatellia bacterium]|nr:hypothetical protein [Blastocatellia bacterium]